MFKVKKKLNIKGVEHISKFRVKRDIYKKLKEGEKINDAYTLGNLTKKAKIVKVKI